MHFAVVTERIPNLETSGGQQTPWLVIKALRDAGHEVTVCVLLKSSDRWWLSQKERADKRAADLRALGVTVLPVQADLDGPGPPATFRERVRRWIAPRLEEVFPQNRLAPKVNALLEEARPDAVWVWGFEGAAATHGLSVAPRMVAVGNFPHTVLARHWTLMSARATISYALLTLRVFVRPDRAVLRRLLSDCAVVSSFCATDAVELRRLGVPCVCWRNPVHDFGGPDWRRRRKARENGSKYKILLIGHLQGTFTRYGLQLLADEVLPILTRKLGEDRFEVHIVGNFAPPPEIAAKLSSKVVRARGWVEDIGPEFSSADVLLVPNPVPLGLRMRIPTGFSFGCCVVAHEANLVDAPELVPGENLLIAKDGVGLAEAVLRALADTELRERLGANGRRTFEQCFALDVAGAPIVAELERMARAAKTGAAAMALPEGGGGTR